MQYQFVMAILLAVVGGCSAFTIDNKHYSIFFPSLSTELDQQGHETVHTAAVVARDNPTLPITLAGYASPPDPADNGVLSARRAANVQQALITEGVDADRIATAAKGTTDPKGLPNLAVQRVDISIGR